MIEAKLKCVIEGLQYSTWCAVCSMFSDTTRFRSTSALSVPDSCITALGFSSAVDDDLRQEDDG